MSKNGLKPQELLVMFFDASQLSDYSNSIGKTPIGDDVLKLSKRIVKTWLKRHERTQAKWENPYNTVSHLITICKKEQEVEEHKEEGRESWVCWRKRGRNGRKGRRARRFCKNHVPRTLSDWNCWSRFIYKAYFWGGLQGFSKYLLNVLPDNQMWQELHCQFNKGELPVQQILAAVQHDLTY